MHQDTLLSSEPPKLPPSVPLLVLDFPLCLDHRKACSAGGFFGMEQHSFNIEIMSTTSFSLWGKSQEGEKEQEKEGMLPEFGKERLNRGRRERSVTQLGKHFLRVSRRHCYSHLNWGLCFYSVSPYGLYTASVNCSYPSSNCPMVTQLLEMLSRAQHAIPTCAVLPGVDLPVYVDTWCLRSAAPLNSSLFPYSYCTL